MIAMQYDFQLPADYDMAVIDKRVRDKGHVFDDTPGLGVKAFLSARRSPDTGSPVNLYAPFYIWTDTSAMTDFLCGERFLGLVNSFGWPQVRSWSVLGTCAGVASTPITAARYATRRVDLVRPFRSLAECRAAELDALDDATRSGALLAMSGLDAHRWERVRFCLWAQPPDSSADTALFSVLHTSAPQGNAFGG